MTASTRLPTSRKRSAHTPVVWSKSLTNRHSLLSRCMPTGMCVIAIHYVLLLFFVRCFNNRITCLQIRLPQAAFSLRRRCRRHYSRARVRTCQREVFDSTRTGVGSDGTIPPCPSGCPDGVADAYFRNRPADLPAGHWYATSIESCRATAKGTILLRCSICFCQQQWQKKTR